MAAPGSMHLSTYFKPSDWALCSLGCWTSYVALRGWHRLGIWDKRQVAFAVFTALLFLNFLTYEEFEGWSDVYYFCGSKLQYCTCNFKWNVRGWLKAYILWSFVLTSAAGLQRLLIQVGLNGLLPGEEVVTRESIISICWRLIPYWLNNWEQQWGAECSSMMFELPHFAVELLVILPCIQILCARLKVLVMPLVHMGHPIAAPAPAAPAAAAPAVPAEQAPAGAAAGPRAGRAGRGRGRGTHGLGVPRAELAPNVLRGYWEHRPEQQRLLPRLRANAQVMLFAVVVTALAASNALLVPLMLESTVSRNPVSTTIQMAGRHPEWFSNVSGLNTSAVSTANLTAAQMDLLAGRLAAYHAPRPPLLPQQPSLAQWVHAYHKFYNETRLPAFELSSAGSGVHVVAQPVLNTLRQLSSGALLPLKDRMLTAVAHVWLGKDMYDLLRSAARSLHAGSNTSSNNQPAATPTEGGQQTAGTQTEVGKDAAEQQQLEAAAASNVVAADTHSDVHQHASAQEASGTTQPQACAGRTKNFKNNLVKHAEEITKMQAPEHRSLIPLVESALAVMRLSCEKYFVLLSVFAAYLVFRDHPPWAVRLLVRLNARLSTIFQKVILYSFPAVCWVYGAGFMFSMFVSFVFWGGPIMAMYESVRVAITVVRIKSLRPANQEALERMGGNCTICWGEMHVGQPAEQQAGGAAGGSAETSGTGGTESPPAVSSAASAAAVGNSTQKSSSALAAQQAGLTPGSGEAAVQASAGSQDATKLSSGPSDSALTELLHRSQQGSSQSSVASGSAGVNKAVLGAEPQDQAGGAPARVGSSPALMQQQAVASADGAGVRHPDNSTTAGAATSSRRVCSLDMPAGAAAAAAAAARSATLEGSMQQPQEHDASSAGLGGTVLAAEGSSQQQPHGASTVEADRMAGASATPACAHSSGSGTSANDTAGTGQEQASNEEDRAWSLPCGHAYHRACLSQWLSQCHTNGLVPTCPMCQARIQLEVKWRLPIPWHPPPDDLRAVAGHVLGAGAGAEAGDGRRRPHREDTDDEEEDGDGQGEEEVEEVGEVVVPRVAVVGLGRQRPAGRVRAANGRLQAHENLLLPPPLAALGGMSMLRLLEHQREVQELLADMPQIAPPEDVELLQVLAAENQALLVPRLVDLAPPMQQQQQHVQVQEPMQPQQAGQGPARALPAAVQAGRQAPHAGLQLPQHRGAGVAAQAADPPRAQQQPPAAGQPHTAQAVPTVQHTAQASSTPGSTDDLHLLAERLSSMPAAELAALLQDRKVMQALKDAAALATAAAGSSSSSAGSSSTAASGSEASFMLQSRKVMQALRDAAAVAGAAGSSSSSAGSSSTAASGGSLSLHLPSNSEASFMPWLGSPSGDSPPATAAGPSKAHSELLHDGSGSQPRVADAHPAATPAPGSSSTPFTEERTAKGRRHRKAKRSKDASGSSTAVVQEGAPAAAAGAGSSTGMGQAGVGPGGPATPAQPAPQAQGPGRRFWRLFQRARQQH